VDEERSRLEEERNLRMEAEDLGARLKSKLMEE
jgi:hypothetical protein